MKKTLAAVAVLGAFADSALAADVQLYGIVDTGLRYLSSDMDASFAGVGQESTDQFSMESGMASGSRWGIKGTEDLGNGLTVGFVLENQFNSDTGANNVIDLFFRRESSLFIEGGFGKFAMGRIGSMNGGVSSWSKHGLMSAFGTSWQGFSANADNTFGNSGIWDNSIVYATPSFAGFKVFAQYGMGTNNNENESRSDRYYGIGASYANGPLNLYFAVDSINYQSADLTNSPYAHGDDVEDSLTIRFGGNYDFDILKIYGGVSYFDEARLSIYSGAAGSWFTTDIGGLTAANMKIKGWSVGLSTSIPAAGGQVLFGASYLDVEAADSMEDASNGAYKDADISRWIVSAGYDYPFSKRTDVYGVVTYNQDSIDNVGAQDVDPSVWGVMIGLRHRF